jgi:hypothetical protein
VFDGGRNGQFAAQHCLASKKTESWITPNTSREGFLQSWLVKSRERKHVLITDLIRGHVYAELGEGDWRGNCVKDFEDQSPRKWKQY